MSIMVIYKRRLKLNTLELFYTVRLLFVEESVFVLLHVLFSFHGHNRFLCF